MQKKHVITVAAAATALGLTVAAAPALSAQSGSSDDASGWGMGYNLASDRGPGWMMRGGADDAADGWRMGGPGRRQGGPGACLGDLPASGSLTDAQKRTLTWLAEEEKLAHDLYAAFAAKYGDVRFSAIAASETRHLSAMRTLLQRYDIQDPTKDLPAGTFSSPRAQQLYDQLLARGNQSLARALGVGRQVERTDIASLKSAQRDIDAGDVDVVTAHLTRASQMHLRAFSR